MQRIYALFKLVFQHGRSFLSASYLKNILRINENDTSKKILKINTIMDKLLYLKGTLLSLKYF